jgi:flagellar hook-length control protein FliK
MVAEQVNYWIGRDVQNAELKLDGMGEGSLKVNISLTGNEARVEFRTDQAQARQVLEGAVSHLKDLLGNEGLVLSSVLVGGSNSGAADSREGRPPAHSRQAAIAVPDVLAHDAVARPATLSGRTVDLFV